MATAPWDTQWQKIGRLGNASSGQGETFRARRRGENDVDGGFVLKVLKKQRDPERRRRMHREVAALQTVKGPGVCEYEDSNSSQFENPDIPLYLVTRFVPGPTVAEAIASCGPISLDKAVTVVRGVLATLIRCHEARVLHRDIKADNVVLRGGDFCTPVLIDFGLSFNEERDDGLSTDSGQHLGNRTIQLPEFTTRGDDKRDAVSDVTQCVGLFFFLLTGRNPEALVDAQGRAPHQRDAAAASLGQLPTPSGTKVTRIFEMGFRHLTAERWPSAKLLDQALAECLEPEGPSSGDHLARWKVLAEELDADVEERARLHRVKAFAAAEGAMRASLQEARGILGSKFSFDQTGVNSNPHEWSLIQISVTDSVRSMVLFNNCALRFDIARDTIAYSAVFRGAQGDARAEPGGSVLLHDVDLADRLAVAARDAMNHIVQHAMAARKTVGKAR